MNEDIPTPTERKTQWHTYDWEKMKRRQQLRSEMLRCTMYFDDPVYGDSARELFYELSKRHAALQ